MKDIYYEGNLNEDINNLNENFDFMNCMAVYIIIHIFTFLILGGIAIKFNILMPVDIVKYIIIFGIYTPISSFVSSIYKKFKYFKKTNISNRNIDSLVDSLDKIGLSTDKERVLDAEVTEEVTNSKTKDDNGNLIAKKKKIVNYFYLLDNEDKIKVLKQVRNEVIKNKEKISLNSMQMLENKDLENMELPVKKVLILKDE